MIDTDESAVPGEGGRSPAEQTWLVAQEELRFQLARPS
jgi:hypothetical protein